jgi:2-keto-4-pentenoate hydratase/2-oxohepta-3-ene-1,7-dioic acid hydratase in catechol pathway
MKWISFLHKGEVLSGVHEGAFVRALGHEPLQDWLATSERAMAALEKAQLYPVNEVDLLQPIIRPGKILGIGLNYKAHAHETGREPPKTQTWFVKQATAANGPFASVDMPKVSNMLDYEAELVVVIGKRGRHVPASRAMEIVAGFCCGCDYSVRDWQRATPTMNMGKGFDTHAPFGPWIITADELGPIEALGVRSFVNGQPRQNGRVGDMIFNVAAQIEHLTKAFTLEPGDVLFTGTPEGVGAAYDPPRFVKPGDKVRVEIDGIGHIENEIVAEKGETIIGEGSV